MTAGKALDRETCERCADEVKARIERWCRMKYRRPVPVTVQPRSVWERAIKQQGYAGHAAKQGAAFYFPVQNFIQVVPWVIGGYQGTKNPPKLSKQEWMDRLESTIIHELMHALHCQNFFIVLGGADTASLRTSGISARDKDVATVDFLVAEGVAELAAARTATREARMLSRLPEREISSGQIYWDRYQPDGKKPFRVILFDHGYQDGIDLLNQLVRKAGPRALRAVLYRPPPRALLFQPELLAKVNLDDPPDPDAVFAFLSPDGVKFGEVFLAVSPGKNRYFRRAATGTTGPRSTGCLLGYTAVVGGVCFEIRSGHAASEIIDYAKQPGCDLVVMATHGVTGLSRFFMGSVTDKVIRSVACPVLIIKTFGKSLVGQAEVINVEETA